MRLYRALNLGGYLWGGCTIVPPNEALNDFTSLGCVLAFGAKRVHGCLQKNRLLAASARELLCRR